MTAGGEARVSLPIDRSRTMSDVFGLNAGQVALLGPICT